MLTHFHCRHCERDNPQMACLHDGVNENFCVFVGRCGFCIYMFTDFFFFFTGCVCTAHFTSPAERRLLLSGCRSAAQELVCRIRKTNQVCDVFKNKGYFDSQLPHTSQKAQNLVLTSKAKVNSFAFVLQGILTFITKALSVILRWVPIKCLICTELL